MLGRTVRERQADDRAENGDCDRRCIPNFCCHVFVTDLAFATDVRATPMPASSPTMIPSSMRMIRLAKGKIDVAALSSSPSIVKPFEQRQLHGTVTICPELKIPHQEVTQK
jgi:hypothetical protein